MPADPAHSSLTRKTSSWSSGASDDRASARQRVAEETHPVAVHYGGHVRLVVAALAQQVGELLQVGNRVEIQRRLLLAETAVEVRAQRRVLGVAGQLTDAVNVIDDRVQANARLLWSRLATD